MFRTLSRNSASHTFARHSGSESEDAKTSEFTSFFLIKGRNCSLCIVSFNLDAFGLASGLFSLRNLMESHGKRSSISQAVERSIGQEAQAQRIRHTQ